MAKLTKIKQESQNRDKKKKKETERKSRKLWNCMKDREERSKCPGELLGTSQERTFYLGQGI